MRSQLVVLALVGVMLTGCAAPFLGAPSATLITRDNAVSGQFEPVASLVKRRECFRWFLILFLSGTAAPTHEGAISRILAEHDADVLLEADLSTSSFIFPYLFIQTCATVEGIPARRRGVNAYDVSQPTDRKGI
jgi:hypothetical protein